MKAEEKDAPARLAFLGNSYFYFNDVPRLLQFLLAESRGPAQIKDCLRGGASWKVLLKKGNGMEEKFRTPAARKPDGGYDTGAASVAELLREPGGWDFVLMNTHSQEAPRPAGRADGVAALQEMAPLLAGAREAASTAVAASEGGGGGGGAAAVAGLGARAAAAVLMATPAYRAPANGSERLGDWADFAGGQSAGYRHYAAELRRLDPHGPPPQVADVNQAFAVVHGERPELWRELFHEDNFHPSAAGSFLEACVLYCAVAGEPPRLSEAVLNDTSLLFARARRMLPPGKVGRLPTGDELVYLRGVALRSACSDALIGVEQ